MMSRRRWMMEQLQQVIQPIYHIENRVCSADLFDPLGLYTGTSLWTDDWSFEIDLTATKMYTNPIAASNGFGLYVNWSGICFYNSTLVKYTTSWNTRTKVVVTHSATDDRTVYGYSIYDGVYTVTDVTGNAIKDTNNYELSVGWDGKQTSGRKFEGTIHDLTVWHGYIPSENEIKTYLGIL